MLSEYRKGIRLTVVGSVEKSGLTTMPVPDRGEDAPPRGPGLGIASSPQRLAQSFDAGSSARLFLLLVRGTLKEIGEGSQVDVLIGEGVDRFLESCVVTLPGSASPIGLIVLLDAFEEPYRVLHSEVFQQGCHAFCETPVGPAEATA